MDLVQKSLPRILSDESTDEGSIPLENQVPVCFVWSSVSFRGDLWQRTQHVACQMANAGYRVIYINHQERVMSVNDVDQIDEVRKRIETDCMMAEKDSEVLVLEKIGWITDSDGNTRYILPEFIDCIFSLFHSNKSFLLSYTPTEWQLLKGPAERYKIKAYYDCVDEHAGFHISKKCVMDELEFLRDADGVIVSSRTLFVRKGAVAKRCVLVPNGADVEHFSKKPSVSQKFFDGPIIGYSGAVAYWFDQNLVAYLAGRNPSWNIVVVGQAYVATSILDDFENVHMMGRKDYNDLPTYLQQFDVGIIPFVMNDLIINTNPIKYFEYAAAGVPIVSTYLPELLDAKGVKLANTYEQFEQSIKQLLEGESTEYPDLTLSTWSTRVQTILNFMNTPDAIPQSEYYERLEQFATVYQPYLDEPLIRVLYMEILQNKSPQHLQLNLPDSNEWYVLRVAIQKGEYDAVLRILASHGVRAEYWAGIGDKALDLFARRQVNMLEGYEEKIKGALSSKRELLEEYGNYCFDVERYKEALELYQATINEHGRLATLESVVKCAKIAMAYGKKEFAYRIIKMHVDANDPGTWEAVVTAVTSFP